MSGIVRLVQFGYGLSTRVANNRDGSQREMGKWIGEQLCEMGPLYIKLGQGVSARRDIVSPEIAEELSKLQDAAPPFSLKNRKLFDDLNDYSVSDDPFACASIAGVFKGTYKGQNVVFKVRRPGLDASFTSELDNLNRGLRFLSASGIKSVQAMATVVQQCTPLLKGELSMENETNNMRTFLADVADVSWIKVPRVLHSTDDYIIMEYVKGYKISEIPDYLDKKDIAMKLMASFAIQVLRNGRFHADLHPGNISVSEQGDINFYDFGVVLEIKDLRNHFLDLTRAVVLRDVAMMIDSMRAAGIIVSLRNRAGLRDLMTDLLGYMENADMDRFHASVLDNKLLTGKGREMFTLNDRFIYLMRSLSMIEGCCRQIYPDFNYKDFVENLFPYLKFDDNDFMKMAMGSVRDLASLPRIVQNISDNISDTTLTQETSNDMMVVVIRLQTFIVIMLAFYGILHS